MDEHLSGYIVNHSVEETWKILKAVLAEGETKILSEASPNNLIVGQGSLWGITPKTAKKTIQVTLKEQAEEKTVVSFSSKLTSDWVNITLVGCVLAAVLVAVCVWMALDLSSFLVDGNPSVWSWIVTAGGSVRFQAGDAFINLTWGLAIFLFIIIATEVAVYVFAKNKINLAAQEIAGRLV